MLQYVRATRILWIGLAVLVSVIGVYARQTTGGASGGQGVIRGSIRDGKGAGLYGIRVRATGAGANYSTAIYTDESGRYEFPALPSGTYEVKTGHDWSATVKLAGSRVEQDFTIELGPGLMNQTTGTSWGSLLPGEPAQKQVFYTKCGVCHSTWRAFYQPQKTEKGWEALVTRMTAVLDKVTTANSSGQQQVSAQQQAQQLQAYQIRLTEAERDQMAKYLFDTVTPKFLETQLLKAIVRPKGEASRAVFTEWDLTKNVKSVNFTWTSPQRVVWFNGTDLKNFGVIGSLDLRTGAVKTWSTDLLNPNFHDMLGDAQGNIWTPASRANKVIKFDPKTEKFTFWDVPGKFGTWAHTGVFDPEGNYWFTLEYGAAAVVRLDPRTGEMTPYSAPTQHSEPYALTLDKRGNVWFTELEGHKVGKIDRKTNQVTEYDPPTPKAGPRRIQMDSKGMLWFSQFYADKIGMLNPDTLQFKDYDIGVPGGRPYFVHVDKNDKIWFNLINGSTLGRLDPNTGNIVFFPFPGPETHTRDVSFDNTVEPFGLIYSRPLLPNWNQGYEPIIGRLSVR